MQDRFEACLAETLRWEGGYSDDRHDPGGKTMRGVIQRVYDGYRDGKGLPRQWVKLIEDTELREIYRHNYWALVRCDELPVGIDLLVFDFCVNSGPGQAVKSLQRVLGVKIDGHFGPATMAALKRQQVSDFVARYVDERRRFYRSLSTFWRFGKGWLSRADGIELAALVMIDGALDRVDDLIAGPAPIPNKDTQAATQGKAEAADPKPPVVTELVLAATGLTSNVTGFASAFAKWGAKPDAAWYEIAFFFLAEPLVLAGILTTFGAVTTYLYRRAHA